MNFQDLFYLGMKRPLQTLVEFPGRAINVGSSKNDFWKISFAEPLGRPSWEFPRDHLPYDKASIATIHCYHFLEHLSGVDAIAFLRECERVMVPSASVLNFCMPYYNSNLQAECLEHRSYWNENSFRNLFNNSGYDIAGRWEMKCSFLMIAGVAERNMCVIGQLVR